MNRSLTGAQATKSSGPAQNSEPQCVTGTLRFRMQQKPCWSALTRDHPRLGRSTEDRSNPRFPFRGRTKPNLPCRDPGNAHSALSPWRARSSTEVGPGVAVTVGPLQVDIAKGKRT